jgi:CDP-diacylglycerol--glycerol-3-phosphate 3-phosphatidyltransferase
MTWTIPNILTVLRLVAALGVAACFVVLSAPASYLGAFLLFTLASATDWLDGRLARAWNQQSRLGEMLDPIADKAIVLITLTALIGAMGAGGGLLIPASIIIFREVFVSGVREYVAGQKLQLKVTQLAKWKTTAQMVAIGGLLLAHAVPGNAGLSGLLYGLSMALIWIAALLTLITGWDYFRKSTAVLLS